MESEGCCAVALAKAGRLTVAEIVASYGSASQSEKMEKFTYLYVLQSETDPSRVYTGSTRDLRERLNCHNSGEVPHTEKWSLGD